MIGFIGGGNMAEALIKGLIQSSLSVVRGERNNIIVSEPREERRAYLEKTYGIRTTSHSRDVISSSNIIILAVKPQNISEVLDEISDLVNEEKTIVSVAAGITLSYLQSKLNTKRLIRVMPNTPALVQEGMSVMSMCECFSDKDISTVREIFMSVGKVITMPERYLDAVTALSGSGPAFISLFLEAMIEGGIRIGLDRDNATELVIQTMIGTARLLENGMMPETIRDMVTSPNGTTAAGLQVFEDRGFKEIVSEVLAAAKKRAEELGRRQ